MVYKSDGRSIKKEKKSSENFLGGDKCGLVTHISGQHNARKSRMSFNQKLRKLIPPNMGKACHSFVDHVAWVNGMSVNYQSGLIHGIESNFYEVILGHTSMRSR